MIFKILRHVFICIIPLIFIKPGFLAAESIAQIQQKPDLQTLNNAKINILAIIKLTNFTINGFKASELSGLAWDNDENILYALSDNGYLLHLRPVFKGNELADILLLNGYFLHDSKGNQLKWKQSDSEGLAIKYGNNGIPGDTELLICFERHPRIIQYNTDGSYKDEIKLPLKLQDINNYQSENKSLEAITLHPTLGVLVGTEQPLIKNKSNKHNVFSLNGEHWDVLSSQITNSGLSDMTTFENGDLLILERGFSGLWPTFEFTLHRVSINSHDVVSEIIATFPANNGVFNDNFEGITQYKDDYFFMVSDDNNHPFKRTLLIYFKILK